MREKSIIIISWAAIFLFIALGVLLLVASTVPFESVKEKLALAFPYRADKHFTPAVFKSVVDRCRLLGFGLLLIGGALGVFRERIRRSVRNALLSSLIFAREVAGRLKMVKQEDKAHLFALGAILAGAILIRWIFLFQPMRYDESCTFLHFASKPLYIGLSNYFVPNNHLFHTLLVHLSFLIFGNHPWAIRLPALIAGVAMVPASYLLIRVFYNKNAALLTAGLVASSTVLIHYSTSARGYTLLCLFFLLILTLAAYLIKSENPGAWLLFSVLSAVGFYTIPTMLYPFGIVAAWLFFSIVFEKVPARRSVLLRFFISIVVVVLISLALYFPVLAVSGAASLTANQFVKSQGLSYIVEKLPGLLRLVWRQWNRELPVGVSWLLVIGFLISIAFHKKLSVYRLPLLLAVFVWLVPILALQKVLPGARIWLFLLPLYLGLASVGLSGVFVKLLDWKIPRYRSVVFSIFTVAVTAWLIFNVARIRSIYHFNNSRDLEGIALYLQDLLQPGDRVIASRNLDPPLEYYFYLHNLPVDYLHSGLGLDSGRRAFAVVYYKHTVEDALNDSGFDEPLRSAPRLIRSYRYANLYEIGKAD